VTDSANLSNLQLLVMQTDTHRSKIQNNSAKENAGFLQKRSEIQERFDARCQGIQERQVRELTELKELKEQRRLDLEREFARPVPEADKVLRWSKLLGQQRKFHQARVVYQKSLRLGEVAREERRRSCHIVFSEKEPRFGRGRSICIRPRIVGFDTIACERITMRNKIWIEIDVDTVKPQGSISAKIESTVTDNSKTSIVRMERNH
jgi:hypothetical protein